MRREMSACDPSGHGIDTGERPPSLSSASYLSFDLCRQPQEPLRFARHSRADNLPVEELVQEGQQKGSADIGVPSPRENRFCMCN
jgi:hypothetical protein